MTTSIDFDRLISSWLETSGPSAMNPTVVDDALTTARRTERRRGLTAIVFGPRGWPYRPNRPAWRSLPMNRLVVALGATVAILVAGFALWPRPSTGPGSAATPSPSSPGPTAAILSTSGSPVSLGGPIPAELQTRWMGGTNAFVAAGAGSSILFAADSLGIAQSNDNQNPALTARAGLAAPDQLRVASGGARPDCSADAVGQYTWTRSASGRTLTLAPVSEICGERGAALAGDWFKVECRDVNTNCLGDLDAGTYRSQYIRPLSAPGEAWSPAYGGVTYDVPDGWANWSDYPGIFGLTKSSDYATTTPGAIEPAEGILVLDQAAESSCDGAPPADATASPMAFLDWVRGLKGLSVGPSQDYKVDTRAAAWADIEPSALNAPRCDDNGITRYMHAGGQGQGASSNERQRLVVVDAGHGNLFAVVIYAPSNIPFPAFATEAMGIVDHMRFK